MHLGGVRGRRRGPTSSRCAFTWRPALRASASGASCAWAAYQTKARQGSSAAAISAQACFTALEAGDGCGRTAAAARHRRPPGPAWTARRRASPRPAPRGRHPARAAVAIGQRALGRRVGERRDRPAAAAGPGWAASRSVTPGASAATSAMPRRSARPASRCVVHRPRPAAPVTLAGQPSPSPGAASDAGAAGQRAEGRRRRASRRPRRRACRQMRRAARRRSASGASTAEPRNGVGAAAAPAPPPASAASSRPSPAPPCSSGTSSPGRPSSVSPRPEVAGHRRPGGGVPHLHRHAVRQEAAQRVAELPLVFAEPEFHVTPRPAASARAACRGRVPR